MDSAPWFGDREFQAPGMLAEQVAGDQIDVFLSVEEAEALADAAGSAAVDDKRKAAVVRQAAAQLRLVVGQVREARRRAETYIDWHAGLRRDERARLEKQLAEAERTSTRLREALSRLPDRKGAKVTRPTRRSGDSPP